MVFVKLHIPWRRLNDCKILFNIQIMSFEINLRKEKLLAHQFTTLHPTKTITIIFQIFDKSIRVLVNSSRISYHFWWF